MTTRDDLHDSLTEALAADRPTLLDVRIPNDEPTAVDIAEFDTAQSFS